MLRSFSTISIGRRVFLAFALTTLLSAIALCLLSTYYFNALEGRDQAVKTAFTAQRTANDQLVNLQRMNALLRTRLAQVFATTEGTLHDPSLEASGGLIAIDILTREITFNQTLTLYQQEYALGSSNTMSDVRSIVFSDDPTSRIATDQQAALTAVKNEWPGYQGLQDQVLQLLDATTNPTLLTNPSRAYEQAYALQFQANTLFLTLTNDWQHVVDSAESIGNLVTNVGPSQIQPILSSTSIAILSTFLVIIAAGYMVNITITRPLLALSKLAQRISKGENEIRAIVRGRDEIAQVAASMNGMLDAIVNLIGRSESQRATLQFQLEQFIHDVSGVGRGNLCVHADVTLSELGDVTRSFNFMVDEFSALIRRVKRVAYEVVRSTSQTSQATQHLVKSADQQISQIEEALRAVTFMVDESLNVAKKAAEGATVANSARDSAREGTLSVHKIVTGMERMNSAMHRTAEKVHRLQAYSASIQDISSSVGRVAQRTQRLSLDVAIQVNLTQTQNTGFAAVVQEIRALAEQVKEEAESISSMTVRVINEITDVQRATLTTAEEMESMSQFAFQAGTALQATLEVVLSQTDDIQKMAKVAAGQVYASQRVGEVMRRVSQETQQGRTGTQAVAQQVTNLGRLLLQLRASVEEFKVSDEQGHVSVRNSQLAVSGINHQ